MQQGPPLNLSLAELPGLYGPALLLPDRPQPQSRTPEPTVTPANRTGTGVRLATSPQVPAALPAAPVVPQRPTQPMVLPAASGAIEWKAKPNARLTALLTDAEYANRELTELLKNIIKALEIPLQVVAFGKASGPAPATDLAHMPTRLGIAFGDWLEDDGQNPVMVNGKEVYRVSSLAHLQDSREQKMKAWELMKSFKGKILQD